jgi:hypothetical protein
MTNNPSRRALRVEAIGAELKKHGIPMHWETIAAMMTDKHPRLFDDSRAVVETLALHGDHFRHEGDGVYTIATAVSKAQYPPTPQPLPWPHLDSAFFLGALCARGRIAIDDDRVIIGFRYGGRAYSHGGRTGYIGKGRVSFKASEVVPKVPASVARRIARVLAPVVPKVVQSGPMHFEVTLDTLKRPGLVSDILKMIGPGSDYTSFTVPQSVIKGSKEVRESFLQGFAQVCGLASAGTNLYGGKEQVWLRPDTANKPLFHQLMQLLKGFGMAVYWNDRDERDIAIKINCQDWQKITFGIDWLDAIVKEGARLNCG